MILAISLTDSKSPGEEIGKPASIMSTPKASKLQRQPCFFTGIELATRNLLAIPEGGVENVHFVTCHNKLIKVNQLY